MVSSRAQFACVVAASLFLSMQFSITGAQAVQETWTRTYGEFESDIPRAMQQTADGGYLLAGTTGSFGAGSWDFWVLKTDTFGNVEWEKAFGEANLEVLHFAQQTSDGGYFIGGYTTIQTDPFDLDFWLLKLDTTGEVEWQKRYGGDGSEIAWSGQQTLDGGYIVAGSSSSFGGLWVIKLDPDGNIEWEKTYSGFIDEIRQTIDGGYIIAGATELEGNREFLLIKLDSDGDVEWNKTHGTDDFDEATSIQQTSDTGYIVAGTTSVTSIERDFLLIKLDADGDVEWESSYGTESEETASDVQQTSDQGYIVIGRSSFSDDMLLLKLDSNGNLVWKKSYGGPEREGGFSVRETSDGGFVAAGVTLSFGAGSNDFLVLKLDSDGNIGDCASEIEHPIDILVADPDVVVGTTDVPVQDTDANVTDTEAQVENTEALITEPCEIADFLYSVELSDDIVPLEAEVRAFATTTDPSVDAVMFTWIGPEGGAARQVTVPAAIGEDSFNPNRQGEWVIEADFQNGQVIRKTLTVGFFVLPESPIGVAALIVSSLAVLGGFLYLRGRSRSNLPI